MKKFMAYGRGSVTFCFPVEAANQAAADEAAADYLDRFGLQGIEITSEFDMELTDVDPDEDDDSTSS
jgi:hypothetical protein